MELELKHLAPYLPYGLKVLYHGEQRKMNAGNGSSTHWIGITATLQRQGGNCKPILRPLSDLTKEIEISGERIVPLHRLFWIGWGKNDNEIPKFIKSLTKFKIDRCWYEMRIMVIDKKYGSRIHELIYASDRFKYFLSTSVYTENKKMLSFRDYGYLSNISQHVVCYELTTKLLEWHFDVFGLIEQDLAININKL